MIGLYVHLPFCLRKCPYCAFYSVSGAESLFPAYVERVIQESRLFSPRPVDTIYFGGGTPTVLSPTLLKDLLAILLERFPCNGEITVEANPATVSPASLQILRRAGFNRISIGVQSLKNEELQFLERLHSAEDAAQTILDASNAGFENISADLMFGLPGQTPEDVAFSAEQLCNLPVSHISAYSLSSEDGTPFAVRSPELPEEEAEREMYYTLRRSLEGHGFLQYEISNFARPGFEAMHNTNYWLCGEYIGLGAGAHGYTDGVRYENTCDFKAYISSTDAVANKTVLTDADRYEERYMLGLRLRKGIRYDGNSNVPRLIRAGLLEKHGENIRLTERGMDIANYVITELII